MTRTTPLLPLFSLRRLSTHLHSHLLDDAGLKIDWSRAGAVGGISNRILIFVSRFRSRFRMRRLVWLLTSLVLGLHGSAFAQPWSGVLDPKRAIDWTAAGVVGGIPTRTTICSRLNPGATTAQINSAIANCPSGQVVFLNAGTYLIAGGIVFNNKSGVTLRGAGPDHTNIVFSGSFGCWGQGGNICFRSADSGVGGDSSYGNSATWTAGYAVGTTSIALGAISKGAIGNLKVGNMLFLDQLDDAADTGQAFYCQAAGVCSTEGGSNNGRPNRGQQQPVMVTSISGSGPWTVGITPSIRIPNIRAGQSPGAWWNNGPPIQYDGVEDLSIDNLAASGPVIFSINAYSIWLKNIRSIQGLNGQRHFWGYQTTHVTIRDSYFYGGPGAADGYGPDLYNGADMLMENNITHHLGIPMNNEGCVGCVFGYNFSIDDFYSVGGSALGWQQNSSARHGVGDAFVLFEGHNGIGLIGDDVHGSSHFFTAFRNFWSGRDLALTQGVPKTQQTSPIIANAYNRYWNIIGNVMGTAGYHTNYQVAPASATDPGNAGRANVSIYGNLGYSGNQGTFQSPLPNDTLQLSTWMRWGNYDVVNNAARFVNAEVPTTAPAYPNPVPGSQALPASFYLSARPAWWGTPWGTPPWPAVGPDVTGGNVTSGSGAASTLGGHAYKIPARLCFENSPGDTVNYGALSPVPIVFNANTCYGTPTAPPSPPTAIQVQ